MKLVRNQLCGKKYTCIVNAAVLVDISLLHLIVQLFQGKINAELFQSVIQL